MTIFQQVAATENAVETKIISYLGAYYYNKCYNNKVYKWKEPSLEVFFK